MMRSLIFGIGLIFLASCQTSDYTTVATQHPDKSHFPNENHFNSRMYPDLTFDHKAYFKQLEHLKEDTEFRRVVGQWVDQGPTNVGARINKIAINPENENEIYLGYARGGVYKTIDGGDNWESVFNEFSYLSISHIEFDPLNTDVVYIGTGDENISHYPGIGNGVYKTTDGGMTWDHLGLSEASIISKIHVSPTDNSILYASAMGIPFNKNDDKGVYKSTDGGVNWDQVLFVNDSTGIIDMVVAPANPDIIYAAGWNRIRNNNISKVSGPDAKIYKSINGGNTWNTMESGLPEGEFVRIGLNMYGDDGNTVFASYSNFSDGIVCQSTGVQFYGLYKTTDGENWNQIETSNGFDCGFQGGFAWYFGKFSVNPEDENDISLLGVNYYSTKNNGQQWTWMDTFPGERPHVDYHDAVYFNDKIYVATDGGAFVLNENKEWEDIENISTNQFYRVAYNPHEPTSYIGGLQDNGIVTSNGLGPNNWSRISGGDGFQARFNPNDPDVFYTESQNGYLQITTNGGQNFNYFSQGLFGDTNWDMQYILGTQNPDILYTGTDRAYIRQRVIDDEWFAFSDDLTDADQDSLGFYEHNITCINQSSINSDIMYVGTSDGLVWNTPNYGLSWNKVIDGLPRRYITEVKASPTFENTAYVTVSGYKNNIFTPYIYKTDNLGNSWESISGDLPEIAINDVLILDKTDDNFIFAATEGGVYYTDNGGVNWYRMGDNFPFIQCLDLEYNPVLNQLIVGTYGKGLRTFDLDQIINVSSKDQALVQDVYIYPNISSDYINVSFSKLSSNLDKIEIIDHQGRLMKLQMTNQNQLDISHLESGFYYCKLSIDQQTKVLPFIKN